MKIVLLITGVVVSGVMVYTTPFPGQKVLDRKSETNYQWNQTASPGSGSFEEKWKEGHWPMGIQPLTAFENKLWMIGRRNSWSSDDGIQWTAFPKADWGERHGMSRVFFKNKIWMTGGMKNWGDFRNDIWFSGDGKNWEMAVENAKWQPRIRHNTVVFKNKLWLIGGTQGTGHPDQLPSRFYNDVWSSDDGYNWTLELEEGPWQARHDAKVIVFDDHLWLIGGSGKIGEEGKSDVWRSPDGTTWTQVTGNGGWPGRTGNGVLVFDDKLWVFGGVDRNDVWLTEDGIYWQPFNDHAPWTTRTTDCSIVFGNKLWIYGGKTGRQDSWDGEVWVMTKN